MKLSKYFIKRPTLFWSLMVAIILGGIYSYSKMPKLEDPEISIKQARSFTFHAGGELYLKRIVDWQGPGNGRDENDGFRKSGTTILGFVTSESQ